MTQIDSASFREMRPLPWTAPLPEKKAAYAVRHDLTERAKEPFPFGWTLGEFLLAGANLGNTEGFAHDWTQIRESNYTDPQWVQLCETNKYSDLSAEKKCNRVIEIPCS